MFHTHLRILEEWTWEKIAETAKKLTFDEKGRRPGEPEFDPNNIVQYGAAILIWWYPLLPLCLVKRWGYSWWNRDPTANKFTRDNRSSAKNIWSDLWRTCSSPTNGYWCISKHKYSLQPGQVAMVIDGQWAMQEAGELIREGALWLSVAPIPYFKEPVTGAINRNTYSHIQGCDKGRRDSAGSAWVAQISHDPENVLPLIRDGLWQPTSLEWYTEEEYILKWIDTDIHPEEYREVKLLNTILTSDHIQ